MATKPTLEPPREHPVQPSRPVAPPQSRSGAYEEPLPRSQATHIPEAPQRGRLPATDYNAPPVVHGQSRPTDLPPSRRPVAYDLPPSAAYGGPTYTRSNPPSAAYNTNTYNHAYAREDPPLPAGPGEPYRRDYTQQPKSNDYHPSGITYGSTGSRF